MATNYVKKGESINYTVPSGGVTSNDIVLLTDIVGVAASTGVENDVVPVYVSGVFEVAKNNSQAVTIGQKLYYDADNEELTTSSEGGSPWGAFPLAGYASEAAGSSETVVEVKLIG